VALQAFFDDSGGKGQGHWMVMAGLYATAEVFAEVADEWSRALAGPYPPGRIAYFKMDEACQLDGEFKHWREDHRDMKVRQMARVVDRPDVLTIYGRMDLKAHAAIESRWTVDRIPGDPQRFSSLEQPYVSLSQFVTMRPSLKQ